MLLILVMMNLVWVFGVVLFLMAWFRRRYVIIERRSFLVANVTEDDELFIAIPKGLSSQEAATLERLVDDLVRRGAA